MSTEKAFFPEGFEPAENDIIVGRQKIATAHSGNLRLNQIIASFLEEYKQSTEDKTIKSRILGETFDAVGNGRFVKLDSKEKKWYQVVKSVARERIGQGFRDSLKDYYKSSLAHKKKRRLVKNGVLPADDPSLQIIHQNPPPEKNKKRKLTQKDQAEEDEWAAPKTSLGPDVAECGKEEVRAGLDQPAGSIGDLKMKQEKPTEATKTAPAGEQKSSPFLPRDGIKLMEEGFEPHSNDIVVGLRKRSAEHPGNIHLVEIVKQFLEEYRQCGNNKNKKSNVLKKIANVLTTQQDPPARFVRLEPKHKRWYEIEAFQAKEKISQLCRDISQDGYRSASIFKNMKRRKSSCTVGQPNEETKPTDASELAPDQKRLPPKKAAARKAAAASPAPGENDVGNQDNSIGSLNQLSKKEQLKRQIEQLKKELEQLEEDEGKNAGEGTSEPQKAEGVTAKEEMIALPADATTEGDLTAGNDIMIVDGEAPEKPEQLPGMAVKVLEEDSSVPKMETQAEDTAMVTALNKGTASENITSV